MLVCLIHRSELVKVLVICSGIYTFFLRSSRGWVVVMMFNNVSGGAVWVNRAVCQQPIEWSPNERGQNTLSASLASLSISGLLIPRTFSTNDFPSSLHFNKVVCGTPLGSRLYILYFIYYCNFSIPFANILLIYANLPYFFYVFYGTKMKQIHN